MLRFGIILFTIIFVIQCSARSLEHGNLIRVKRTPYYCDPAPPPPPFPPQQPYWQPPPPLPPPPFWHHHHHGPGPLDRQDPSFGGQEILFPDSGPSWPTGQRFTEDQNEPCENCNRKNTAVSNSHSVNGDAISIAITRSKTNT